VGLPLRPWPRASKRTWWARQTRGRRRCAGLNDVCGFLQIMARKEPVVDAGGAPEPVGEDDCGPDGVLGLLETAGADALCGPDLFPLASAQRCVPSAEVTFLMRGGGEACALSASAQMATRIERMVRMED
jgi:hypothetical protein